MRDVIKILAAGVLLSAYAVVVPSIVEAVPAAASAAKPEKPFPQRLVQAGGDAPVSAVSGGPQARIAPGRIAGLPRFVQLGAAR